MQSYDSIRAWVIAWLMNNGKVTDIDTTTSYIEQGLVDSLSLVRLVSDVENEFRISFFPTDFQKEDFVTADGISKTAYVLYKKRCSNRTRVSSE
jgi:acyl carrier protein